MVNKSPRIFIGMVDTAGIGSSMALAFKQMGHKVTCYSQRSYLFPEHVPYDYRNFENHNKLRNGIALLKYIIRFLVNHDIFIFISSSSLLPYMIDLPILKLLHKKIVMFFCGCDINHFSFVEEEAKRLGFKYYTCKVCERRATCSLEKKRKRTKWIERYADLIFCHTYNAHLLSREYQFLWNAVNVHNIVYHNRLANNERPVITHAPSRAANKGTRYVLEAIARLKEGGYKFEFKLLQDINNLQVREILAQADISIDQLMGRAYGVFAVESMAAGCAVLGCVSKEYMGYPDELPIIPSDPDNIYENLKMLLDNPGLRHELGKRGKEYQQKYHNPQKIARNILDLLMQANRRHKISN